MLTLRAELVQTPFEQWGRTLALSTELGRIFHFQDFDFPTSPSRLRLPGLHFLALTSRFLQMVPRIYLFFASRYLLALTSYHIKNTNSRNINPPRSNITMADSQSLFFTKLPRELRDEIYRFAFESEQGTPTKIIPLSEWIKRDRMKREIKNDVRRNCPNTTRT